ncbi:MAG: CNNM domain-containing protein [Phycisphaerales bacterium]
MILADLLPWIGVALLGVALSSLFSGMETGVYCVNRLRLRVRAERGEPGARLLQREIDRQQRVLATLLIGNNIANYTGSLGVAAVMSAFELAEWQAILLNACALTPLLFVFGETLPKELFRAEADRLTPRLAPALLVVRLLATISLALPLVQAFAAIVQRLGGASSSGFRSERERVASLLHEGARFGLLSESQTTIAERVLAMQGLRVRDEMTPWAKATTVGVDWTRAQVESRFARRGHSYAPVVDNAGRVLGVLDASEVWRRPGAGVRDLMRPPLLLEAESPLPLAIVTLREADAELAVVTDGARPVGVATMKDLIEPVTGELHAF